MDKKTLTNIVLEQKEAQQAPSRHLVREKRNAILKEIKYPFVSIITGVRRCGKSTLLNEIRKHNKKSDYYLNFDDDRLIHFRLEDFQLLVEIFLELFGEQKTFYFDEIQNIEGWERFIRRLHDQGNKVFIAGSNAIMFSKELGTRLTGRHIKTEIFPFSFYEIVHNQAPQLLRKKQWLTKEKVLLNKLFQEYLNNGGFPDYVKFHRDDYLQTLYDNILYRDMIAKYKINERAVKELAYYIASNVGKEISFNSLSKTLGLSSGTTVADYCSHFEECYLAFLVNRFDFSLKKQLQFPKKAYFIDPALARLVGFRISEDRGRLLENIIFLELKRRGKDIYFHRQKKECDFLIRHSTNIIEAIQVTQNIDNQETKKREINGLLDALEHYNLKSGLILTERDEGEEKITYNGKKYKLIIKPIYKWLLEK